MILLAPALSYGSEPPKLLNFILKIIAKIFPTLPFKKLKYKLSDDKEIMNNIKNDKLIYKGKLRLGTALTIKEAIDKIKSNYANFETPFYLLQGKYDQVVDYKGSNDYHDKTKKVLDKTYLIIDGNF